MSNNKSVIFPLGLSMAIGVVAYYILVIRQSFFRVYGHYGEIHDILINYYYGMGIFYFIYTISTVFIFYFHIKKTSIFKLVLIYLAIPTLVPMISWFFYSCIKESIYRKSCFDMTMYDFFIKIFISFIGSYSFIFVVSSVISGFLFWSTKKIYLLCYNKKKI